MANLQPTYTQGHAPGYAGMVANGEKSNRLSRNVEDAAGIAFGKAAFRGVNDRGCTATPSAGKFLGVTIADPSVQSLQGVVAGAVAADIYPRYASAGLMNEGVIWVIAGAAVAAGAAAYVAADGAFSSANTGTAIPAVFDDTAPGAGAFVRLRIRHG